MTKQLLTSLFLLLTITLIGQDKLQSPSEFLPFELGSKFTPHHMVVDYFEYVAAQEDNINIIEYGRTNEDRPLKLLTLSSPQNMANIETIRMNNLKAIGMEEGAIVEQQDDISIVWLSFGVHGNEAGASESSMNVLYNLANKENTAIQEWLKTVVVIMDPSVNPDGYSRYTHWNRGVSNKQYTPNPESREHSEPWPSGRVNHYLYDLNRDWAWATQVESQQRLKYYQEWMPHVHVDFHEQHHDDPYYFAPAAAPYHDYITDWQGEFQTQIGLNHTKYFDEEGWLYFTREIFDLFYPSYGDTYPTFNGAIGMTYEQGGHSKAGRAIETEIGDVLTLFDRIDHHTTTGLSTVEMAAKNSKALVNNFHKYFDDSRINPPGKYKAFVIKADNTGQRIEALTKLLDRHLIKYGKAGTTKKGSGYDYTTGRTGSFTINADDIIISAHQPKGLLTQVLFEPEPYLEDSLTYDITAWALPYAYGLNGYALTQKMQPSDTYTPNVPAITGDKDKAYAYVAPWTSLQNVRFLSAVLQAGVKVRYAGEAFAINGKKYEAGTLLMTKGDNRIVPAYAASIEAAALEHAQELDRVTTGFVTSGHDFGSESMKYIDAPKVLIISGETVNNHSFGQVWHYFEQDIDYPVTVVAEADLGGVDLHDYNLMVLTDGYYKSGDAEIKGINEWVNKGGRLILIGSAIRSFAGKSGFGIKKALDKGEKKDATPEVYGEALRKSIMDAMPGAVYKINLDNTHPLGFGQEDYYFSLKTSGNQYEYLDKGWTVGYIDKDPFKLGFVGSNIAPKMAETMIFGVEGKGRGSVTYMVDNPLFRSFWENGKFLFSNAVFFL